ncbi:hypothetical protein Hte_011935 [Hypoxylon texense]
MAPPRRIPPAEWEGRKDRIVELYLNQNLTLSRSNGTDGVIETMEREGFIATKSQYEAKFKAWGVRKNLKQHEWTSIIPTIQESRRRGEPHPVELSGRVIPSFRVDKAQRRYKLGSNQAAGRVPGDNDRTAPRNEVSPASTSEGQISVIEATLGAGIESTDPTTNSTLYGLHDLGLDDLGFDPGPSFPQAQVGNHPALETSVHPSNYFGFGETHNLDFSLTGLLGGLGTNYTHPIPSNLSMANEISLDAAAPPISSYASSVAPFHSNMIGATERLKLKFPRKLWIGPLPSAKIMTVPGRGIYSVGFAASTYSSLSGASRYDLLGQFFQDVAAFPWNPMGSKENSPMSSFPTALRTLASEETFVGEEQDQFAVLSKDDAFESRFCSRLIRSLMNGLAGLGDMPISAVLRFLKRQAHSHSLLVQFLRSGPKCEAKSLAENTFQAALQADDVDVVKLLLEHRLVDANDTICHFEGGLYTPLAIASRMQSFKIVQLLLDLKVDVNKIYQPDGDVIYTPFARRMEMSECLYPLEFLLCCHGTRSTPQQAFLDLIDGLLNAGATIRPKLVKFALSDIVNMGPANVLVNTFAAQDPTKVISESLLKIIIKNFDRSNATRIVKLVIEMCEESNNQLCFHQFYKEMDDALNEAIACGYLELAKVLLPYSVSLDKPFRTAIEMGMQEVIDIIIKKNPDLDEEIGGVTPLAAALYTGNQELLLLLKERGVLDRLRGEEFGIAINAALEAGNIAFANQLLDQDVDADGQDLIDALAVAIDHDYDHIAWKLLALGASIAPITYSHVRPSFPLYTAIKKKSDLTRAMLDCHLPRGVLCETIYEGDQLHSVIEAAIEWGDHSILSDLLHKRFWSQARLQYVLEKAERDLFWMIVKSYPVMFWHHVSDLLMIAVRREDTSLLRELFDLGIFPDHDDVLAEAVQEHPSMVEPLLKRFREVYPGGLRGYGQDAIEEAIQQHPRYSEGLSVLFAFDLININKLYLNNSQECNLLSLAIAGSKDEQGMRLQDIDIIKKLLDSGFDANMTWWEEPPNLSNLLNPLLEAIETRNINIVYLLIDRGARVNEPARGSLRRTPLQKAAEVGSLEIVRLMIEKGADVNAAAAGRYGGTALQFAAISGNCTMATELIERGARFDTPPSWGPEGRWPLEGAAEHGRIDMIQLLWYANRGNFDDKQYQKAMRLAERNGHIGCRDKITELMATPRPATAHLPVSWEGPPYDSWGEGDLSMLG